MTNIIIVVCLVLTVYDKHMYDLVQESFKLLPLCTLLENRILVLHGGLFSDPEVTLEDIQK